MEPGSPLLNYFISLFLSISRKVICFLAQTGTLWEWKASFDNCSGPAHTNQDILRWIGQYGHPVSIYMPLPALLALVSFTDLMSDSLPFFVLHLKERTICGFFLPFLCASCLVWLECPWSSSSFPSTIFKTNIEYPFFAVEYPLIKLEISSTSHPFYTGKMKLVDTAGRVDKFMNKYKKFKK